MEQQNINILSREGTSDVFASTPVSLDELRHEFPYYDTIMAAFADGTGKVELRKRFMLKMIDEVWVRIIEDTIPSLDTIVRKPGALLEELEEVLPIEQTKKVTSRSVQHLSQHTDLINEIRKDGTIVPSKLLNVFQDETLLTYENRFINTLLARLYGFVELRYQASQEFGSDEKNTLFDFFQEFDHLEQHGKIHLTIEVSERPQDGEAVTANSIFTTDLWKRVEKIRKIVTTYMDSPFAHALGKSYVRPPIMRTNKILKNVDFRQCLTLWEFLESYENTGYESLIREDIETVDENCLKDFYNSIAAQYVLFKKHIQNAFEEEKQLDARETDKPIKPEIKQELDPFNERDYDITDLIPDKKPEGIPELTGMEDAIEEAIRIALAADALYVEEDEAEEAEEIVDGEITRRYRYSFLARLIKAKNPTQDFYTEVKNELLSYEKVKSRISWNYETFTAGRKKCARINVRGKTLYLYLPLDPKEFEGTKYHLIDCSDSKRYEDYPALLKVRSGRGVKWAKELIAIVMARLGLSKLENYEYVDFHLPYMSNEEMLRLDPPLVKLIDGTMPEIEETEDGEPITDPVHEINIDLETLTDRALPCDTVSEIAELPEPVCDLAQPDVDLTVVGILPDVLVDLPDEGFRYRYRYSFLARLIQSDDELKSNYAVLKNHIMSYDRVRSKIAWAHEAFGYGRGTFAKLKIRGKAMVMYIDLDPKQFADTKYHVQDLTEEDGTVPQLATAIKIRGSRSLKHAMELVDLYFAQNGGSKHENPNEVYDFPYETTDALVLRGLVKLLDGSVVPVAPAEAKNEEAEEPIAVEPIEAESEEMPVVLPEDSGIAYRYRYSFLARLIQSDDELKSNYAVLKNHIMSYDRVRSKIAWAHEAFGYGRGSFAKLKIRGKAIALYIDLDPKQFEGTKYHVQDLTEEDGTVPALPTLMKVRGSRSLKHAMELVDIYFAANGGTQHENPNEVYDYPYETTDALVLRGLVKLTDGTVPMPVAPAEEEAPAVVEAVETVDEIEAVPDVIAEEILAGTDEIPLVEVALPVAEEGIAYRYRYSFLARLIQADDECKNNYGAIKNRLLSYARVRSKIAWGHEAFGYGRGTVVKIKVRAKTVSLWIALDPKQFEGTKYRVKDLTREDGTMPSLPTLIKVRGSRSLKHALEIIDLLMQSLGAVQGEIPDVDYYLPYQTTEELLALPEPLIKPSDASAAGATAVATEEPEETEDKGERDDED